MGCRKASLTSQFRLQGDGSTHTEADSGTQPLKGLSASNKTQRNTQVEKLFRGLSKMLLTNLTLRLLSLL